ncbi:kinase-like protein [Gigaspora margarita]|uniref:Kinase-like protein n=1 Tax=Gigaspora margarita TaxID=4874 RepID=A0A8H4A9K4_GIGMA|nr:kinase-like protein [Gigaspora margarita]
MSNASIICRFATFATLKKLVMEVLQSFTQHSDKSGVRLNFFMMLNILTLSSCMEFQEILETDNFMLVLQFANGGNLRTHLEKKREEGLYKICWVELIQFAKEITDGLTYLHNKDIIHRDLHSKNILINDGKALISDFGISKQLNSNSTSSSNTAGLPAYIEPQCYFEREPKIKRDKRSDIYSLGVLFWELTSGIPPFNHISRTNIIQKISRNEREKIIPNTPSDYVNLYEKCWSTEPDERPTLNKISIDLDKLSLETVKFITNNIKV